MTPTKWLIAVMAVTIAVLAYFTWRGSHAVDKIMADVADKARVNDSLKSTFAVRDSADSIRIVAVSLHDSLSTRKLDSALRLLGQTKDTLKTTVKRLKLAVSDLGSQVARTGDSVLQHLYDSVSYELDKVYLYGGAFVSGSDSTIALMGADLNYKDSIMTVMAVEISDLKKALTLCTTNFDGLKKDTDKIARKAKTQALISKIRTGLEILLAAIVIIK